MSNETYTDLVLREFRRLKRLADQAITQVSDQDFLATHDDADNSIADVVKHMAGNMHSRWRHFLTADGEKPDRSRDQEFLLSAEDTRQHLIRRWESGWQLLFNTLAPLLADDFERTVTIRGEPLSVLQAINRQLTHYAYHVGQIVYVARHFAGERWKSLSVPKGKSESFNEAAKRYLAESDA